MRRPESNHVDIDGSPFLFDEFRTAPDTYAKRSAGLSRL